MAANFRRSFFIGEPVTVAHHFADIYTEGKDLVISGEKLLHSPRHREYSAVDAYYG